MGDVFKNGVEDRYPKELLDKRAIYEGNVIGCLWREPKIYYDDWKLNIEDFLTIDGMAFFKLGKDLYSAGFTTLDESSIITYMADKPKLEEWFENKGGYKAIQGLMDFVNMDNADAYLDNLNKSNILLNLFNNGFDVVNHLDTFEKMPSDMVYQWYDFKLNNLFVKKQIGIKIEDLVIDDGFLKETNAGNAMGISYSDKCPILSYSTLGIHKKNLMLIAGHSGTGKTSFISANIMLPLLKQGKKFCVISNEQNINEYKRLILASVISNELENFQVDRKKIQIGHWSDEQWDVIRQAQEYINQYKGNIKFVQCYDYDISSVKKIIHTLSKQGVEIFLYDTFKSSDLSVSNSWGNMVEDSKVLFQAANRENVAVIATMQLAISTLNTRYLTSQCLSTAKGVKEVCSDIILFRKLWDDERTGETYDVKGHYFKKENGIYLKEKQELITIPDKKYTVFFLDKTRSGTSDIQLLYKTDLRYNTWKELGYCKSHQL